MLIRSYGLFWEADEITWNPGRGSRFELLGRRGMNRPALRIADFRNQRGLYVLYRDYGPYYVGLARHRGLGDRIKDHMVDHHKGRWRRFSWFGFRRVLTRTDQRGYQELAALATYSTGSLNQVIGDMEALLIKTLGCSDNLADMNFPQGEEWHQVWDYERADLLAKLRGKAER